MLEAMRYEFVRVKDFIDAYRNKHPEARHWLWLDILNEAIAESGAQVVSVGYDSTGDPMTLLLRVP
jgi:hypothetical protein